MGSAPSSGDRLGWQSFCSCHRVEHGLELQGCELAKGALATSTIVGLLDPGDDGDRKFISAQRHSVAA